MPPTESQMPVAVNPQPGGGTISLATLIDYIVQRTYHELNVLSELLPRKNDMERKIEIVQFASRTRQLYVRLLALVKWANSASKVDKCGEICNFLEQQSMWFVDTADCLARMARNTLVSARLPNFSVPCAVDVLTLGTYPRLPSCIRDRIVPPDPITPVEKRQTLQRLNQVIQYRLVSCELPPQMRKLIIENGRVKFFVENEFQVTLTLMGDRPSIPWRLLDINIEVEDHETGDGKSLVHSLQVNYVHQLVQSRLLNNDRPLHDLYRVLHSFCQSLQLEVLHSQTQRLVRERLGDSIRVEDYTVGKCLVISYWREQMKKEKPQDSVLYKLKIHVSEEDGSRPLQISHIPPMSPLESRKVGLAIKGEHLSVEKLLMQTIEVRTQAKLKYLGKELKKFVEGTCEVKDVPVALHVPVLHPCMDSEQLRIMVDAQRGALLVSMPSRDLQAIQDIEEALNTDKKRVGQLIVDLRLHLSLLRCEKSLQCLPTTYHHQLPFVNLSGHPLEKLGKYKLFIKVPKQMNYVMVIECCARPPLSVEYKYYILHTVPCLSDGGEDDLALDPSSKFYLNAGRLLPIDTFSVTHGPFTKIFDDSEETEIENLTRKRKLYLQEKDDPIPKKQGSPYFVAELAYVLASCEERIPFVSLGEELTKHNVGHTGVQVDGQGTCFSLSLIRLPDWVGGSEEVSSSLQKTLISCKFRMLTKPTRNWLVEFVFSVSPLPSTNSRENGPIQRVYFSFDMVNDSTEKVVQELLDEWAAIGHLFGVVSEFAKVYNDSRSSLQNTIEIRSYSYKRLSLAYGPAKASIINIQWKTEDKMFHITLGTTGPASTINPHVLMATQLQQELNYTRSVAQIAQVLHDTWYPLTALSKLSSAPLLGAGTDPRASMLGCTVIPQSTTHVRIAFRNVNCIDVHFRSGKVVAVRDGAISLFDTSKAIEGFTPTPGLKAFLNMFVDDAVTGTHTRRRSTTEDDNPPSPVGMDSMDVFMAQQPSMGSPASRRQEAAALRFHGPMTPPSNPHTPASPSASRISSGHAASPAFPLASPPSIPQVTPPPSSAFIGTPSPGTLLGVGSPGNPQLHVPSPGAFVPAPSPQGVFAPAPSPQSLGIPMQSPAAPFISPLGMDSGSPYPSSNLAMPSPGARNWPNSPSVPGPSPASRHGMATSPGHPALHSPLTKDSELGKASVMSPPSRMLPQRSWAASIPTLLSHDAFNKLLTPHILSGMPSQVPASPLERFLGCVFFRKHLPRVIQSEGCLSNIQSNEPGVILFKVDALQFRVSLNPNTLQSLHMKVSPIPDHKDQCSAEEIQILERFFEFRVACPPYKANALTAFGKLLGAPVRILKDCIQIMRLELMPDRNLKWAVQLCLTIPPGASNFAPAGTPAIYVKVKMVIFLQLTRIGLQLPPGTDPQSIVVPLLYNIDANTISQMNQSQSTPQQQTPAQVAVSSMLQRFTEFHQNPNECAIYPAVRELMQNLVLPVEGGPPMRM